MKNYEEMANDVLRRIDEYDAARKQKRKILVRTVASIGCACLIVLLGLWKSGMFDTKPSVTLDSSVNVSKNDSNTAKTDIGDSNSKVADIEVLQKEIAYEIATNSDYNKLALNFSELVKDADLILKIRVESTNAFINDNGMIQTEITPIIQEVYKGGYYKEKLYVNGGEMLYDEFIQNEVIKKAVSGHENPSGNDAYKGKYVRQSVDDQYIFNVGEEYVFFAKKRIDSGKYYSLYAYQGTFKISNGMVENAALDDEEPLKKDIEQMADSKNKISVKKFAEKIKNLER